MSSTVGQEVGDTTTSPTGPERGEERLDLACSEPSTRRCRRRQNHVDGHDGRRRLAVPEDERLAPTMLGIVDQCGQSSLGVGEGGFALVTNMTKMPRRANTFSRASCRAPLHPSICACERDPTRSDRPAHGRDERAEREALEHRRRSRRRGAARCRRCPGPRGSGTSQSRRCTRELSHRASI